MSEKNHRAQALADDLHHWIMTRSFYGPPPSKNILAMMSDKSRPSRSPPNAPISAEMAAFYIAVCGLPDKLGEPFIRIYCKWPEQPVKKLAFNARIDRDTYYDRAHRGANMALRNMNCIMAMVENTKLLICRNPARQDRIRQNEENLVY